MSVETTIAAVGNDVKSFFTKLVDDVKKAKAVWDIISDQQTRALLLKLGGDFVKAVKDGEAAVAAYGANLPADAALIADVQTLIADAQAGDGVLVADLKALGITF